MKWTKESVGRYVAQFPAEFQALLRLKPRFNLKQVQVENCDYSDTALKSKNCYYCFGAFYCEDVYYGRYSRKCRDCSGVTLCVDCEGCVECSDCAECYFCDFSKNCRRCSNCCYCVECYSCDDCFGCVGLYKKRHCWFNEQLTEAEFQTRRSAISLTTKEQLHEIEHRLEIVMRNVALPATSQFRTEDSVGNYLTECSNCYQCFDGILLEDCFYVAEANANKSACDLTVCFETELCYSCVQSPLNYNCNFLFQVDQSADSEFCAFSKNLRNCFGCVYLANKEFHILNTPFSEAEYRELVPLIRHSLIERHQYNLGLFQVSDYEKTRLRTEPDPVIQIFND